MPWRDRRRSPTAVEGDSPGPVLYVVDRYPSLSETFISQEIEGLVRRGFEVLVLALKQPPPGLPAAENYLVPPARPASLVRWLPAVRRVMPLLVRRRLSPREALRAAYAELLAARALGPARRASVAHVHAHFLVRPSDVARVLAARLGVSWSATAHAGDVYDSSREAGLQALRLRSVAAVACISRDVQRVLAAEAPWVRTRVVHCGVDAAALSAVGDRLAWASGSGTPRFVTVGRLQETKGYRTVLRAAEQLVLLEMAFQWDIVGDGPMRGEIQDFVARNDLVRQVVLHGAQGHQATLEHMAGATALVLPCQHTPARLGDGIPVVLMEAMAMGTVVVTSPVGGIPELVDDGRTGLLVPPEEPEALAELLGELATADPGSLNEIRQAARRTVAQRFTLTRQVERVAELLAETSERPLARHEQGRPREGNGR